jgi:hypothetical protein
MAASRCTGPNEEIASKDLANAQNHRGSRTMFASRWIFGRDRPPKKPRRSGAAKWEERRPKKDHYSLAESSKCVQIDVAFIPHASDPQASAM